jgi:hypothetical protein
MCNSRRGSAMDEFNHLYCSVCAWKAIRQHFIVEGRGHKVPEFVAVSSGEVRKRARDVWEVPRAQVVFGGASLCLFHMATRVADQTTIADPGTPQESLPPSASS